MSATIAECGCHRDAIAVRLVERSEPMIKTLGLTERFLPFPQPMSRPTDPGGRVRRNVSMIGQGCYFIVNGLVSKGGDGCLTDFVSC